MGIEPPVEYLSSHISHSMHKDTRKRSQYQLQNALAKYLFANSLCKVWPQPSPCVAFPPFTTVPLSVLMSVPGPVFVALPTPMIS